MRPGRRLSTRLLTGDEGSGRRGPLLGVPRLDGGAVTRLAGEDVESARRLRLGEGLTEAIGFEESFVAERVEGCLAGECMNGPTRALKAETEGCSSSNSASRASSSCLLGAEGAWEKSLSLGG